MNNMQQQVFDWMVMFGQEVNDKPTIPSLEIRKLRAKLILEEALETIRGLGFEEMSDSQVEWYLSQCNSIETNLIEVADGIADSLVVLLGTAVACGIDIEPVFEEVMRSNNSKMWKMNEVFERYNSCLVEKGISHPMPGQARYYWGEFVALEIKRYLFLVKDKDGKVIKSPSYSPANIKPLLEAQGLKSE